MNAKAGLLNKRGQSIVEISLITPLLLAALYVVMDFGILFFTSQYAQNAAREGARIASILPECPTETTPCVETAEAQNCPGDTHVVRETCDRLPGLLGGRQVAVTLTGEIGAACMREVEVLVTGTYNFGLYRLMALLGFPTEPSQLLTRSAGARFQGQPVSVTGAC